MSVFKLIIAGGRKEKLKAADKAALNRLVTRLGGKKQVEIVTGGATGIDTHAYLWAKDAGIPRSPIFHAEWKSVKYARPECIRVNQYGEYNNCAGHERNVRMADYADGVVLFPGGTGTADMGTVAEAKGLRIWNWMKREYDGT